MDTYPQLAAMPEQSASIIDRLRYLITITRMSQAKFARHIGMDPSSMSKILSATIPASDAFINRIVVSLGVSKEWLLKGEGVPFAKTQPGPRTLNDPATLSTSCKGAPVYDVDATAGARPLSHELTSENIIGFIDTPQLNPTYPLVRVSGDSMTPRIPNGSYVAIREIRDPSILSWGSIYLVELEDYRMVKYVRRHPDPDKIILHSENPAYDDIEVLRSAVIRFFLVEQIVNFDTVN